MKVIDIDTWDRKEHYEFFSRSDYPHYHIGANLDITEYRRRVKEQDLPLSFALTYTVTQAMNQVEAFRYRFFEGKVVLYDKLHPYFAYNAPNKKYFKMVLCELEENMADFAHKAKKKALDQEEYFIREDAANRSDLIFISSIPKVSFTHLSHTITLANPNDANPRLSWGKCIEENGKLLLPLNVQVHHAFVDGDHLGEYFEVLQTMFYDEIC